MKQASLLGAYRAESPAESPLDEIEAALAPADAEARPAPPVLLPSVQDRESASPAVDEEPAATAVADPTGPTPVSTLTPVAKPAAVPRSGRGRGRPTTAQLDSAMANLHLRFPRGMSSWSANLRVPPSLVSELDDWKWRFFTTHQREALNTRILSIALERITAEDLVARAEQLRSVDPATNIPWAVRIPASMRPLMVELTRATAPALDKSQVGVAALAKFLDDFTALAPQQQH